MKLGAYIAIAALLLAFGAGAGVWFTTKANGDRTERLTGEKVQAAGERDLAVSVSEETVKTAVALLGEQVRIAAALADENRAAQVRAAEEAAIKAQIARAPPEDRGRVPKVVADTVRALYAAQEKTP